MQAQAVKEQALKQKQLQNNTDGVRRVDMVIGKDAKGQQLVHRDIFASTTEKIVQGTTMMMMMMMMVWLIWDDIGSSVGVDDEYLHPWS